MSRVRSSGASRSTSSWRTNCSGSTIHVGWLTSLRQRKRSVRMGKSGAATHSPRARPQAAASRAWSSVQASQGGPSRKAGHRRYRTVVFVHGCFWHRHAGCRVAKTPKSNTEFWVEKFGRNQRRDELVASKLQAMGWRVIIAWECDLTSCAKARDTAQRIHGSILEGSRLG